MANKETTYSLLTRINKRILIPISVVFLTIGIYTYKVAYHEAEEVYDAQLARSAGVLMSIVEHEVLEHGGAKDSFYLETSLVETEDKYEEKLAFRVWLDGELVTGSANMKDFPSSLPPTGFSDIKVDKTNWRVFLLQVPDSKIKIEVAELYEIREELIEGVLKTIFAPLILLIPLITIVVWAGLKSGLIPVNKLSVEVEGRRADNLKPLETTDIPLEIKPLTTSINHLMKRMENTIENERQFTDNAAHELRTPLASIKTLAQVANEHSKEDINDKKLTEILEDLVTSTDRATHLVEQLLDFARLHNKSIELLEINFADIINNSVSHFKNKLDLKEIKVTTDVPEDLLIKGNSDSISMLSRNLIDNAYKYTPRGGTLHVKLTTTDNKAILEVTDTGVGIPESEKDKVMERFYRVPGSKKETGCGLGLAIVKWIAEIHGGSLTIKDNPEGQGTSIVVTFSR